jgi:hypothetical protein
MDQFPPNSKSSASARVQNDPKRVERVTSAPADRRPRGLGHRFKSAFIGGDMRMAFDYMVVDIVIPAIQDTLIEAFQGGVERLIKGEGARPRRRSTHPGYSDVGHVDYKGMHPASRTKASQPRMLSRSSRARGSFDELIISSRSEAEEVLDRMFDILSRYGGVSVADLYELTGVQSQHTDMKWGWTQLRGSKVVPLRRQGGYVLDLPEVEQLD